MASANAQARLIVTYQLEGLDPDDVLDRGWELVQARIARVIASEVARRVNEERQGMLRIMRYVASTWGRTTDGGMELRVPDAALVGDGPEEVSVWHDPATDETVYRWRRAQA